MTAPTSPVEEGEVRVGWYSYQGHPHFAHSHDEARALLGHGHEPIDDKVAAEQVAEHTELVVEEEPDEEYDEAAFAKAVADEAPKKTTRTRRQASQEE